MTSEHRVPAGVPTGGEFTTGQRSENADLEPRWSATDLNRVMAAAKAQLDPEDVERVLAFCDGDEEKAVDLLQAQQKMIDDGPPYLHSYYDLVALSGQAMAEADCDVAEARRKYMHLAHAAEMQGRAEIQAREAKVHLRQAAAAQVQSCASLILAKYPTAYKITLMPGPDEPRIWLVFTEKRSHVLRAHQFGGKDDLIDLGDPADLSAMCVGYDKVSGKAEGLRLYTNGTLREADLDLTWYPAH